MSRHGILKYVLSSNYPYDVYAPEDKDPPEGKELESPNLFGSCTSKVIPSSS